MKLGELLCELTKRRHVSLTWDRRTAGYGLHPALEVKLIDGERAEIHCLNPDNATVWLEERSSGNDDWVPVANIKSVGD